MLPLVIVSCHLPHLIGTITFNVFAFAIRFLHSSTNLTEYLCSSIFHVIVHILLANFSYISLLLSFYITSDLTPDHYFYTTYNSFLTFFVLPLSFHLELLSYYAICDTFLSVSILCSHFQYISLNITLHLKLGIFSNSFLIFRYISSYPVGSSTFPSNTRYQLTSLIWYFQYFPSVPHKSVVISILIIILLLS